MKIGIESQRIFRTAKHGMDVVAVELIRAVQRLDTHNEYLLFAKNGKDRGCVTDTDNFSTQILKGFTYADWEQIALPAAVRKFKPQLLHCTGNTAPFRCNVPMIVTVHDIIYIEETNFAGSAYQNFGNLYRKIVVPHAIKHAKKIVTVSNYEKGVISDICNVDPERIEVIYNGVSERFHTRFSAAELSSFRGKYHLPEKFILFFGNTAPKKNTAGALSAYVYYCLNTRDPLKLVVTDYPADGIRSILEKIGHTHLMKNIVTPGYVPSALMPVMYNCATVFVYPSLRESFGLPVLEAMACAKPVVAADIPPLREVAGTAALFVDPEDPVEIAEKIVEVIDNSSLRNDLKVKGFDRVRLFDWGQSARKLIELYHKSI